MLEPYYSGEGPERGGVVLRDGTVVELPSLSDDPAGFRLSGRDCLRLGNPDTIGTWHSHPGASCNLSVLDREAFLGWPNLLHWIVGDDGEQCYAVEGGEVCLR